VQLTADYGDLAEPSMKLSRALLIVLLLHVVAVAGIIAFNAIKTRQQSLPSAPSPTTVGNRFGRYQASVAGCQFADYAEKQCKARRQKLATPAKFTLSQKAIIRSRSRKKFKGRVRRFARAQPRR